MSNKSFTRAGLRQLATVAAVVMAIWIVGTPAASAQASLTTTNTNNGPNTPMQNGVSVAVDCLGNIYYTNTWLEAAAIGAASGPSTKLFKMNVNGTLLATVSITDSGTGAGVYIDEMTWD